MNNHGYYRDDGCESDCATHNEPAYPNGECDCIASLPQRLRKLSAENKGPRDCIDEAADEIDVLRSENKRLRNIMESLSRSVMADIANQREPLTSSQINALVGDVYRNCGNKQPSPEIIVRAIERAHGIGA